MGSLSEILAREMSHPVVAQLFHDLLGAHPPAALAAKAEQAVAARHGPVARGLFAAISVGAVFGVETAAGERLVLKIFPRAHTPAFLARTHQIQRRLGELAFPVPHLRSDPFAYGSDGLFASLADYVDGEERGGHDPATIRALAHALAAFSELAAREGFAPLGAPALPRGRLWPPPHKSSIRLKETSAGAGFLRDRALRARKALAAAHDLPLQLAHLDWGVKNTRFRGPDIVAIFDWDSLGAAPEAVMVGKAAAQFTAHWEIPTKLTPSPEEARLFLSAYEDARGRRFPPGERAIAAAAADLHIAWIGRQEWGEGNRSGENTYVQLCRDLGAEPLLA
jgi:Ser/Thr protein kinase RdoA (MazF antagonist)